MEMAKPARGSGGDATQEETTGGTPGSRDDSGKKTKRLLPMELRRRRRAAKLQVVASKQQTAVDGGLETPEKKVEAPLPLQGTGAEVQQAGREKPVAPKPPAVSATARLRSMYSGQTTSRKRVKVGHGTLASVPSAFPAHVLPTDFVPKSRLIIQTMLPLPFLRPDSRTKKLALESFLSEKRLARTSDSIRPGVRWHRGLLYFTHPAAPLPASITLNRITAGMKSDIGAALPKGELMKEELAFYEDRFHTWQHSLRDLYLRFRKRHDCSTFYVRSSEFVVCFYQSCGISAPANASVADLLRQKAHAATEEGGGASEDDDGGRASSSKPAVSHAVCAVVSQSNSRIRKALLRLNVDYSLPYSNASSVKREAGEFHLLEEELSALKGGQQSGARVSSTAPAVHGPDSLLLFQGHGAVHGLFEFLINRKPLSSQDVPELFALHPFEHGTIQTLQVTSYGRAGSTASGLSAISEPTDGVDGHGHGNLSGGMFRLEIRGFCFPESVIELLSTLQGEAVRAQERDGHQDPSETCIPARDDPVPGKEAAHRDEVTLRVYMEPVKGSERLNATTLAIGSAAGRVQMQARQTMVDRERHAQTLEFTKRRIESVVARRADDAGLVTIETTARVAQRGST